MYPYRNRWRWLLFGRYSHLVKAVNNRKRIVQDTTLEARVESLKAWNSVRFTLGLLLAPSVVAAVTGAYVNRLPTAPEVVEDVIAFSTALAGLLSLAYVMITRILGQLEIDILAILTLEHGN